MARRDHRDRQVQRAPPACKGLRVRLVQQEHKAPLVRPALQAHKARLDQQANKGQQVLREARVLRVPRVTKVIPAHKAQLV